MPDLDNRIRLMFHVAYSRLAERGIISEEDLERVGELLDNLDTADLDTVRRTLAAVEAGKAGGTQETRGV